MKKLTAAQAKALEAVRNSDGQQNVLFFEAQGIRSITLVTLRKLGYTQQLQRADGSFHIVAL